MLDEDARRIEVVVGEDQLSLAIGRRGQNVRLASQLTSWQIDILTEAEESERRQKEFAERTRLFMESLDVDETVAQLLASEGFRSVEELTYVDLSELASVEGFDEETAAEIQNRAITYLAARDAELHDGARVRAVTGERGGRATSAHEVLVIRVGVDRFNMTPFDPESLVDDCQYGNNGVSGTCRLRPVLAKQANVVVRSAFSSSIPPAPR